MLPLDSGINSRLPSVNHALISPILHHPVLWVALPPSVPSTHQILSSITASLFHSMLKTCCLSFCFSGLTTWISQTVYCYFWAYPFLLFSFSVLHLLVVISLRYIKLTHVGFRAHVKLASRIVSYPALHAMRSLPIIVSDVQIYVLGSQRWLWCKLRLYGLLLHAHLAGVSFYTPYGKIGLL